MTRPLPGPLIRSLGLSPWVWVPGGAAALAHPSVKACIHVPANSRDLRIVRIPDKGLCMFSELHSGFELLSGEAHTYSPCRLDRVMLAVRAGTWSGAADNWGWLRHAGKVLARELPLCHDLQIPTGGAARCVARLCPIRAPMRCSCKADA